MEKNQYIVAFEIGSSKIVGAIADKSSSGYITVRMLEEERLINSVRHGEVKNVCLIWNSFYLLALDLF